MSIIDLNNLALKNDINLNKNELDFTYKFIKDNYIDIINNPNKYNIDDYKNNFTDTNYNKIKELINKYKKDLNSSNLFFTSSNKLGLNFLSLIILISSLNG